MDNLEKFIRDNRPSFDREVPKLNVWSKIDRQMESKHRPRVIPIRRVLSIAAAILVLLVAGVCLANYVSQEKPVSTVLASATPPALPEEYREVETFYEQKYEQKLSQLANYQVDPTFREDLRQFEEVMTELKIELNKAPKGNEERIVSAIIQNYQTKLDILQRVLDRVQQSNPQSVKSRENEVSL